MSGETVGRSWSPKTANAGRILNFVVRVPDGLVLLAGSQFRDKPSPAVAS